jgi:nitrate reductase gamma subunit
MSIFHIINFKKKKNSWTQEVLDFFDKKLILDYFIHLFDSGILLIIDLNKKKGKKGKGEFYL